MNGPINTRRMDEIRIFLETFETALVDVNGSDEVANGSSNNTRPGFALPGGGNGPLANVRPPAQLQQSRARLQAMAEFVREIAGHMGDEKLRNNSEAVMAELQSVVQMVAVEVLEIRGTRAMKSILRVGS